MNFLNLSTPKQTHDFKLRVNNIRPLCCWILKSIWDLWLSIINKSSLNSGAFWSWGGILEPQSERQPIFIPVLVLKDTWCTVRQALRALLTLVRIQDGPSAAAKTTPGTNRKSLTKQSGRTKPGYALKADMPRFIMWILSGSTELVWSFVLLGFWAEL